MGHERLVHLKQNLLNAIEGQMCNIYEADCNELGEAIDMLKDLEEALYFATITEAMNGKGKYGGNVEIEYEEKEHKKNGHHQKDSDQMYYPMYMDNGSSSMYMRPQSMYNDGSSQMYATGSMSSNSGSSSSNYTEPKDYREGRSPMSRRMYMEAKEMNKDKAIQLRELEKYMQELSQDMTDMIADASPEEKQYLEKKISALASKIGSMK